MKLTIKLVSLILAMVILLSACAPAETPTVATQAATMVPAQPTATTAAAQPTSTAKSSASIPNPAAKYCTDQGLKFETRTTADGSQYGVCKFPDGSECEEWAYYRGKCKQGEYTVAPTPTLTPASTTTN